MEDSKIEYLPPEEIEKRSFEIITEELLKRNISLPKEEELITKRVIHTSADALLFQRSSGNYERVDKKWS